MTIQIQHPFTKKDVDVFADWIRKSIPTMTISVHRLHAGQCWFEATSEHPMDFYKLGIFSATHLEAKAKIKEQRKLRRQQQEN